MASSLLRSLKLASSVCLRPVVLSQHRQVGAISPLLQQLRPISTSKNKDGTGTVTADGTGDKVEDKPRADDFSYEAAKKKWVSFGFHWETEEQDLSIRNFIMFMTVTIAIVGTTFILAYMPDIKRKHWFQREAYIELARREALGLPLIDPNLVPPENINLPTEEELGEFDIIV